MSCENLLKNFKENGIVVIYSLMVTNKYIYVYTR